jgi:hypothetical protein
MSRSDELEYDSEVDIDGLLSEDREPDPGDRGDRGDPAERSSDHETASSGGLRSRLPSWPSFSRPSLPLPRFTIRGLGLSLVVSIVAFVAASLVVPLGGIAGLVGIFVAAFGLGLVGHGHYLELAVAGAGTAAAGTLLSQLFIAAVADLTVPLAAVGGTAGLLAAVLGCYFGRDLRAGLTRGV